MLGLYFAFYIHIYLIFINFCVPPTFLYEETSLRPLQVGTAKKIILNLLSNKIIWENIAKNSAWQCGI